MAPDSLQNTLGDWGFENSGYNTVYAICLDASAGYVPLASYVSLGPSCDAGDVTTSFATPDTAVGALFHAVPSLAGWFIDTYPGQAGTGAAVCIDNPPAHTP